MHKIALEEHFMTPELAGKFVARPTRNAHQFHEIERRLADFDTLRLEAMDKAGIDLAVLSATTPGIQGEPDAAKAIELARETNDTLAEKIATRPNRFAGFACLPMQDVPGAIAELRRTVTDFGFKGALINGQTGGAYLDADIYLPFWEAAAELDVPIYLHPGDLADHPAMLASRPELDGSVWAWTVETATHALRLVFGGTFARVPGARLILGHMGETLPYMFWRIDNRWQRAVGKPIDPDALPSAQLRRHVAVTTSGVCDPAALAMAIAALGEDNVMFSVDYPYEDSEVAARFIEAAPLAEATREKICRGNAIRWLRL